MSDKPAPNPIVEVNGVRRFKKNRLIAFLLDSYEPGLNRLVAIGHSQDWEEWEWSQLYQCIGYSIDGFAELESMISADEFERATGEKR